MCHCKFLDMESNMLPLNKLLAKVKVLDQQHDNESGFASMANSTNEVIYFQGSFILELKR